MKIYIDEDFRCRAAEAEGLRAVETEVFDGKCAEYIEGRRFVPAGEVWTREDGHEFHGEMMAPWKDYAQLEQCQAIYERMLAQQTDMQVQNEEYETALTEIETALGVTS